MHFKLSLLSRIQSPWFGRVCFALLMCQALAECAVAQTQAVRRVVKKPAQASEADAKIGQDWVRLKYGDDGKIRGMQTAIVRYAATDKAKSPKVEVDLIGAVHVGDVAYYQQLNERFKQYDALLYELVAPEGTVVQPGRGTSNAHPIGAMQNMIKNVLDLDHQLEYVDYTKPNFIHADMSPDEFQQAMTDRHEGFLQMYFKLLGAAMARQNQLAADGPSNFDLLSALFASDRPRQLKIILAKQLSEMEGLMVSFGGEQGSVIISERNKKALAVLKRELADGKKHVGIFYGAGHLSDMDQRLRADFKFQPVSITWLTAWDLAPKRD
jgi:hypothetical protein